MWENTAERTGKSVRKEYFSSAEKNIFVRGAQDFSLRRFRGASESAGSDRRKILDFRGNAVKNPYRPREALWGESRNFATKAESPHTGAGPQPLATMITYKEHIRALAALGTPIVVGQLGVIAQAFADTIMVGQHDTDELSAAGFVSNVFNLVIFFLLGFSYSTTPIVGRFFGKGQLHLAARTLRESLVANLAVCAVASGLMYALYLHLDLLRQPAALMPLIRPYFLLTLASLPFVSAFNALKQFCDGVGDTKTPMWTMVGGNVLNIAGNALLIFGLWGCPELGLNGAGIATLASRAAMLAGLAWAVRRSRRYAPYRAGFHLPVTRLGLAHLTRVGLPVSLQMSMESSSFNITAVMMGWLGATALAAHQVMCTVGSLCFLFYYGIGAAAAVRMSHFRGMENWAEVRRTSFAAFFMATGAAAVLASGLFALQVPLAYCFTTSGEVVKTVTALMLPFILYQLGDSAQTIFANSLRAVEDVKPLVWYAAAAYLLVSIPLSYVFGFVLGWREVGIWFGFPFGLTTAGLLFYQRFYRRTRRQCA